MKLAFLSVALFVGTATAGVTFQQNGQPVSFVTAGTVFEIDGNTTAKNATMSLCVDIGGGRWSCQQVQSDVRGDFVTSSMIDDCNFEKHLQTCAQGQVIVCDQTAKTLHFGVWKWGAPNELKGEGFLTVLAP